MLHTVGDFQRMRAGVAAKKSPWYGSFHKLTSNPHAQSTWRPHPLQTVYRGVGSPQNYQVLYNDVHAAYQNALLWKVTNWQGHGDAARDILNAWSATLTGIEGADGALAAGIYGYQFANAAEIMRGYPGFDLVRFRKMMVEVFYPISARFLTTHNGAVPSVWWANWDICNMAAVLAIGILCDDRKKVAYAIDYFKHGAGSGSIMHAVPYLHPGGLGQWQESCRDQDHTMLGIGLMGAFCEMAWNQGYDCYGYADSRFLKACEYVAKYNLGHSVPFTPYTWKAGTSQAVTYSKISPTSRGEVRPVWELVYNHYVRRRRLHAPYTAAYAARVRPEGGGGDYGSAAAGYDQLGFGSLTFSR